jgi:hypothetical protein
MVPLLKSVEAPSWFRRLPSVTVVTVASELLKRRSNWAPVMGVAGVMGIVRVKWAPGVSWKEEGGWIRWNLRSSKTTYVLHIIILR